jgi:hypothetical protein
VLTGGTLITKSQAISRLAGFGVPAGLAAQISGRQAGETIRVPALQRISRGYLARRIMQRGVRRLGSLRAGSMQAEGGTR